MDVSHLVPPDASPEQLKAMLRGLRDLPTAIELALMPPAWIWWMVPLAALMAWLAYKTWTRTLAYRRRVQALRELDRLRGKRISEVLIGAENILKRVAIQKFGPDRAACLYDKAWVDFLVDHSKNEAMPRRIAMLLAKSTYDPDARISAVPADVLAAAAGWVRQNL